MAQKDFSDKYNTPLSDEEENAYQSWAKENHREKDTYDYDMRGAWKSGATADPRGHLPDTFKKPNHPTFSDESIYHGKDGYKGGHWGGTDDAPSFTPSDTNLKQYGKKELQDYFQKTEPSATLNLPKSRAQRRYGDD